MRLSLIFEAKGSSGATYRLELSLSILAFGWLLKVLLGS
jgi:hypothetical protein